MGMIGNILNRAAGGSGGGSSNNYNNNSGGTSGTGTGTPTSFSSLSSPVLMGDQSSSSSSSSSSSTLKGGTGAGTGGLGGTTRSFRRNRESQSSDGRTGIPTMGRHLPHSSLLYLHPTAGGGNGPSSGSGSAHGHGVSDRGGGGGGGGGGGIQRGPHNTVQQHTPAQQQPQQQQQHLPRRPSQRLRNRHAQYQLTPENAAALPPPGLSGPSAFSFSPSADTDGLCFSVGPGGGRYLAFLSSPHMSISAAPAASSSSSSVTPDRQTPALRHNSNNSNNNSNTNGSNNSRPLPTPLSSAAERRLCVIDMEPFVRRHMETEDSEEASRADAQPQRRQSLLNLDASSSSEHGKPTWAVAGDSSSAMDVTHPTADVPVEPSHEAIEVSATNYLPTAKAERRSFSLATGIGRTTISSSLDSALIPRIPLRNPDEVAQHYLLPLLNDLSPDRSAQRGSHSSLGMRSGHHGGIESETESSLSLEERLRRERQRLHSTGITQFTWSACCRRPARRWQHRQATTSSSSGTELTEEVVSERSFTDLRLLVPIRGNIFVQDGVGSGSSNLRLVYEKSMLDATVKSRRLAPSPDAWTERHGRKFRKATSSGVGGSTAVAATPSATVVGRDAGAIDPQLSPDGSMVAFVVAGEIYVIACDPQREFQSSDDRRGVIDAETGGGDRGDRKKDFRPLEREARGGSPEKLRTLTPTPVRVTFGAIYDGEARSDNDTVMGERFGFGGAGDRHSDPSAGTAPHGKCITHGLADFVAQEEMDRYRGFWWDTMSTGILFTRVDESGVPPYRITHQGKDGPGGSDDSVYEDHRYPFAGENNPEVKLGYVAIDRKSILGGGTGVHSPHHQGTHDSGKEKSFMEEVDIFCIGSASFTEGVERWSDVAAAAARANWNEVKWFEPPPEASEYLARVSWLPDGTACAQWQDRSQSSLALARVDIHTGETTTLHVERSDVWINLHHMFRALPRPVHPDECQKADGATSLFSFPESAANQLPDGSFSFLFASERTGYCHLYLYTFVPGNESAALVRAVSGGDWVVESIAGVDMENDIVYVTGTYDSPLERHLYALPLVGRYLQPPHPPQHDVAAPAARTQDVGGVRRGFKQVMSTLSGSASPKPFNHRLHLRRRPSDNEKAFSPYSEPASTVGPPNPLRLTEEAGMHSVVMDDACRFYADTSSDLGRPTSTKVFAVRQTRLIQPNTFSSKSILDTVDASTVRDENKSVKLLFVLYDASRDDKLNMDEAEQNGDATSVNGGNSSGTAFHLPPPELLSFPCADGSETLHAALYRPDSNVHGAGPYPLICAVYGGPHVQRVNRSWGQCADMRAQRLRSLGFAVLKCDNRGSARRGIAFEGAIRWRLGRVEVLDQVTAVRHLVVNGIADPHRVGVYGWSYGGYLAAMCLCRAPDVFHVAVAGAPVTSWDGYDTHYTERYMGLPAENPTGYAESAVFDHVPNMKGRLMIVHGLIDENVHFRHTARLINRLISNGKDYDLLIFPDERHSPRRLRDRIYMEKRISDFFTRHLLEDFSWGMASGRSQRRFPRDKEVGLVVDGHEKSTNDGTL